VKKSLQFALSALVLAVLLVFFVDVEETWQTLQRLDPRWTVAGLFLMTVDRLLMTYKWLLLLGIRGYSLPLLDATALYCRAMIWGLALPSTVGADAIRTLLATRRGVRASDAVSSIVVERAIGFLTALALAIFSLAILDYYWPEVDRYGLLPLCALALSAGLLLLVFSFNHRAFTLLERMVPARWHGSMIMRRLENLHEAYRSLGAQRSVLVWFTVLTLLEQLITFPFTWVVAKGLGLEIPFVTILIAMPLAILISRLPVTFDGIGIFEAIIIAVLAQAGVNPAQGLALALASRVIVLLALLPWFVTYGARDGSLRARSP
jgi:uncharacterized protein (TIRG00374 family)